MNQKFNEGPRETRDRMKTLPDLVLADGGRFQRVYVAAFVGNVGGCEWRSSEAEARHQLTIWAADSDYAGDSFFYFEALVPHGDESTRERITELIHHDYADHIAIYDAAPTASSPSGSGIWFDDARAKSEGWGIFPVDSPKNVDAPWRLWKVDEESGDPAAFETGEEAKHHVAQEARRGSAYHILAIDFLRQNNPLEYEEFCSVTGYRTVTVNDLLATKFYPLDVDSRVIINQPFDRESEVARAWKGRAFIGFKGSHLKSHKVYDSFAILDPTDCGRSLDNLERSLGLDGDGGTRNVESHAMPAVVNAGNESIADRLVVTVDQADGHNVLVALAPVDMSEREASDLVRARASVTAEYSDLISDLGERGFHVFSRFVTVDID